MLLTKPLITFLNANRTPQLHTLILITPTGKLLSSSSALPASTLRSHATLASSIFTLYPPLLSGGTLSTALPSSSSPSYQHGDHPSQTQQPTPDPKLTSILIQLDLGTMIIRPLKCSLLFVAIGPGSAPSVSAAASPTALHRLAQDLDNLNLPVSPSPSTPSLVNGSDRERDRADKDRESAYRAQLSEGNIHSLAGIGLASVSMSDTASLMSVSHGSLRLLRRQTEELARWLDGQLEDFALAPGV